MGWDPSRTLPVRPATDRGATRSRAGYEAEERRSLGWSPSRAMTQRGPIPTTVTPRTERRIDVDPSTRGWSGRREIEEDHRPQSRDTRVPWDDSTKVATASRGGRSDTGWEAARTIGAPRSPPRAAASGTPRSRSVPSVRPMTAREQRRAKKCDRGDSTDGVTAKPGSAVAAPHTARTAPAPAIYALAHGSTPRRGAPRRPGRRAARPRRGRFRLPYAVLQCGKCKIIPFSPLGPREQIAYPARIVSVSYELVCAPQRPPHDPSARSERAHHQRAQSEVAIVLLE